MSPLKCKVFYSTGYLLCVLNLFQVTMIDSSKMSRFTSYPRIFYLDECLDTDSNLCNVKLISNNGLFTKTNATLLAARSSFLRECLETALQQEENEISKSIT